jgi:tetratricopeptide (TPR) repeat protein
MGTSTTGGTPPPITTTPLAPQALADPERSEFERHLKVGWSCLQEAESKIEEILSAKSQSDREVDDGTLRGVIAAEGLHGNLQTQFQEELELAKKSADSARAISTSETMLIDNIPVTPDMIFADVCALKGQLQLNLEQWDSAIALYKEALQYLPNDAGYLYNLGVSYLGKGEPEQARQALQQVIRLNTVESLSLQATKLLYKLDTGSIGKKQFRGSWIILILLGLMTLGSFLFVTQALSASLINVVFWGGITAIYYSRKFK